ncbi:MAG: ATP synthase F1 subunit gamma [Anaerolineae bacterium]|jgi:F-type H+-transporting ATPase subunit gamma|nr:ATP synthase F1 subunit gamma [Chloroflexota bacterium]
MASLREVRGRMRSVGGIAKVVHAMGAVSAVTVRRLQARVESAAPYADWSWRLLSSLPLPEAAAPSDAPSEEESLQPERTGVILFSSTRGMAGAFDHNVIQRMLELLETLPNAEIITVGTKGRDAMKRHGYAVAADWSQLDERSAPEDIAPLAAQMLNAFHNKALQRVLLVYTRARGEHRHQPAVRVLLPVDRDTAQADRHAFLEPGPAELAQSLLPAAVESALYLALVESLAAEYAARAIVMRSASNNARDLAEQLRLTYNKMRQEAITAEMNEVSSALSLEAAV